MAALLTALAIVPIVIATLLIDASSPNSIAWRAVSALTDQLWPSVPQISTVALAQRLDAGERPLLIDTRTRAEYEVSHLPGAVWAGSPAQLRAALPGQPSDRLVVLYCSVGIRSTRAAATLVPDGGHTIVNLRGSIFQWANEGRPLERNGAAATLVHPYNSVWGRLLDARLAYDVNRDASTR